MTVENISWSISTKECYRPQRGLNLQPPGLQSDGASNWATEAGKTCVTSKDSDQPVHPPSLARVLVYHSLDSPKAVEGTCNQQRLWSDCPAVQADLSLRWSHKSYCRFCHAPALSYSSKNMQEPKICFQKKKQQKNNNNRMSPTSNILSHINLNHKAMITKI